MKEKDSTIEADGIVTKIMNGSMFQVKLDNGFEILGMPSGKMRKFGIKITLGDKVQVEMSTYDLTKGRIVYRYKN